MVPIRSSHMTTVLHCAFKNVDPANLSSTNFEFGPGPVCLAAGTLIQTPEGLCPIEDFAAGDLVATLDHGPQPIVAVLVEEVLFKDRNDRRRPILIAKGALGDCAPDRDIIASPQHRFLITDPLMQEKGLIPAVKLTNRAGVRRMRGVARVRNYNLLLPRHEIIFANGCEVESLLVTPYLMPKLRAEGVSLDMVLHEMMIVRSVLDGMAPSDGGHLFDLWSCS